MKTLLFVILGFSLSAQATIIPVDKSARPVQDELFGYQWGLMNQGQTLVQEKDDIHNRPVEGVVGKDIGWNTLLKNLPTKRPVIAILDSGVDLNHPELQGNLWKNAAECGKDSSQDNDNNQLAGDCDGWNFTEEIGSKEAKTPSDTDGHGTHIAGIIAAKNNGKGMVGVLPNALIMPIKVMRDSNSSSSVPSSEAFARGIYYAVENGADVINMSLGWPRSLETKMLRDAVYYALENGVPIVAAAGNNNSSEPLYPCAYDGVICVGATTVTGDFASFSNFGGHVDTIAPGESILGLNPTLFEPELFSVSGHELRSGTSQATPFVAALVGALKANNPEITIDEIFARLYGNGSLKTERKYILGSETSWEKLNKEVTTPVVRPVLKNLREIIFSGDKETSEVRLMVRNFGLDAQDIKVSMRSLSKGIEINNEEQTISALAQGKFTELKIPLTLTDLNAESNVKLEVMISLNGASTSYITEIPVLRDLRAHPKFQKEEFVFKDKKLPVGVNRGLVQPLISTLEGYGNITEHEFFMKRSLRDESKLELTVFTKKNGQFVQHDKLIEIPYAVGLVNFKRVDLNLDGKLDYFVQTLAEVDGKKFFTYSFYDENLNDLWSGFQHVTLTLDVAVENLNDVFFLKMENSRFGTMMLPAYFTTGIISKIDQKITSWDRYDSTRKARLYYLNPEGNELKIRTLTHNVWEESLKTKLGLKWSDDIVLDQILPVSTEDARTGSLRVLVAAGKGSKRNLFVHKFNNGSDKAGNKIPQLVLQTEEIDPLLKVSGNGLETSGDVFFNIYDRTRAKLVKTSDVSQVGEYVLKRESDSDLIAGHIASFESAVGSFSVLQTREELVSISGNDLVTSRPKMRYSFLSQKLLTEMYYPVTYRRDDVSRPALYVDSTAITGDRVSLFEEQEGKLVSSIRNSVFVPRNCKALNPYFSKEKKTFEYKFLCDESQGFVIRTFELN